MRTEGAGRRLGRMLWLVAFVAMLAAARYQRRTGPTYEFRGTVEVGGRAVRYALTRSGETDRDARVVLPLAGEGVSGRVMVRRYPTDDPFTPVGMREEAGKDGSPELAGTLPAQPAAGKLEYYVEVHTPGGDVRIPAIGGAKDGGSTMGGTVGSTVGSTIVMRYKDPVPLPLLLAHILFMFVSMLIGVRAALGALAGEANVRRLAWLTLGGLSVGGMILGPFVQKYAFGAFWTGFPRGYDLTDNKTLIMWLAWLVACAVVFAGRRRAALGGGARLAVVVAALVTVGVYLIPHSLRGSQLDYGQVGRGVDPGAAIRSGR